MLGKKHFGNERIYRKRMFAKSPIEIEILENLRKPLTRKSKRKRTGAAHKNRKRMVLLCFAIRAISVFRVKFNVEFTPQAVNFSIKLLSFRHLSSR